MTIIITITCLAALTVGIVWAASAPASRRSRSRDLGRRMRHVSRHPQQVNSGDIGRLLVAEGVSSSEARLVIDKATARGIKPFTMLMWIQQYDAGTLSVVVAADLDHQDLLVHLANGTVPDLRELALFASLNGLPIAAQAMRTPVGVTVVRAPSVTLTGRPPSTATAPLPAIFEPGAWPKFEDLIGQELLAGDVLPEDLMAWEVTGAEVIAPRDWHMAELDDDDLAA
ncbi:hypothetical protein NPS01_19040 [Nocardioides psychrotolerans]|uniref:Uncharacterized protein n=1 Tax=Nocardioides psychrotolerans TaxID=1005945 RepID=A0A1I3J8C2_9ACTN|nr:hypothetical protein [Nocardioides psychrotolerans]GEP38241.1 hypothetical protein NPS01_19040 [Nocardioides psychrotolerans]SFI56420.1 hypothetical protein SAMN05216561_11046 [Nocardioides psychrotolerans]